MYSETNRCLPKLFNVTLDRQLTYLANVRSEQVIISRAKAHRLLVILELWFTSRQNTRFIKHFCTLIMNKWECVLGTVVSTCTTSLILLVFRNMTPLSEIIATKKKTKKRLQVHTPNPSFPINNNEPTLKSRASRGVS